MEVHVRQQDVTVFQNLARSYQDLERLKHQVEISSILARLRKSCHNLARFENPQTSWQDLCNLSETAAMSAKSRQSWQDPGKHLARVIMSHN